MGDGDEPKDAYWSMCHVECKNSFLHVGPPPPVLTRQQSAPASLTTSSSHHASIGTPDLDLDACARPPGEGEEDLVPDADEPRSVRPGAQRGKEDSHGPVGEADSGPARAGWQDERQSFGATERSDAPGAEAGSQRKPNRPCKFKRERFKEVVEALEAAVLADPHGFDIHHPDRVIGPLPSFIANNPTLFDRLFARLGSLQAAARTRGVEAAAAMANDRPTTLEEAMGLSRRGADSGGGRGATAAGGRGGGRGASSEARTRAGRRRGDAAPAATAGGSLPSASGSWFTDGAQQAAAAASGAAAPSGAHPAHSDRWFGGSAPQSSHVPTSHAPYKASAPWQQAPWPAGPLPAHWQRGVSRMSL